MDWIKYLTNAVNYIEKHLTEAMDIEAIAANAYASSSHFQLIFHLVMGMTVGKYIRNRRLSLAAQDLLQPGSKITDVAALYQYDSQESFSKAFTGFHGVPPSKVKRENIKVFHPFTIKLTVQGGFDVSRKLIESFLMLDAKSIDGEDAYGKIARWAGGARGRNPGVFDALTAWILDDDKWTDEYLKENEWILTQGVLARFKEQNAELRGLLKKLEPTGVVNQAVFNTLDRFDDALSGKARELSETVQKIFTDFSVMKDRAIRAVIAGNPTGSEGVNSVEIFGYINYLKECDASVQWTLFMPYVVKDQQKDFKMESFEYRQMPAFRFVGFEGGQYGDAARRLEAMKKLDAMADYRSGFDYDLLFMHHYGLGVDVGPWHGVWGRFMKAGVPVPEGCVAFDFMPEPPSAPGTPYLSRFAFATFSGDMDAMHTREGYDSDAMYDVTRNTILAQGANIPYPAKYWTAEVFLNGCDKLSTGYLFSVSE